MGRVGEVEVCSREHGIVHMEGAVIRPEDDNSIFLINDNHQLSLNLLLEIN